jgi:hypothetical protein
MCIFWSEDEQVDIFWINRTVLIAPEGPEAEPAIRVIVNGLIRPKGDHHKDVVISFAHKGEIYALEDWSDEWLEVTNKSNKDWLSSEILNNRELGALPTIEPHDKDKLLVRSRRRSMDVIATVANCKQNRLSDIDVYCCKETHKHLTSKMPNQACFNEDVPIYSTFSLSLKGIEPDYKLFRITFCTKSGVHPYHSQINVDVEGPDESLSSIERDIDIKVVKEDRHDELRQQIDKLPRYRGDSDLDIAVVSHPTMSLMIEYAENAGEGRPIEFPLESAKAPVIKSAACNGRVAFFGESKNNAIIKAVATPVPAFRSQHSPEFLEMFEELKKELRD